MVSVRLCYFLEVLGEISLTCLVQLLQAVHILWLLTPPASSKSSVCHLSDHISSEPDLSWEKFFQGLMIRLGSPGPSPHLKFLNLNLSCSHLPCEITGRGYDVCRGGIICLPQPWFSWHFLAFIAEASFSCSFLGLSLLLVLGWRLLQYLV